MRLAGLLIVLAYFGFQGAALACTCAREPFTEHFRGVDIVFEGTVVSVADAENSVGAPGAASMSYTVPFGYKTATFKVGRAIKGVPQETRAVSYKEQAGGNCGTGFAVGETYRVYAHRGRDGLVTSGCAGSHLLSDSPRQTNEGPESFEALLKAWAEETDPLEKSHLEWSIEYFQTSVENERFIDHYVRQAETDIRAGSHTLKGAARYAAEWRDYESMAAAYAAYAKLRPSEALGHQGLAEALMLLERHEEAIAPCEKALALDPEDPVKISLLKKARLIARGEIDPRHKDYRDLEAQTLDIESARSKGGDFSGGVFGAIKAAGARLESAGFRMVGVWEADFTGARLAGARFDAAGAGEGWAGYFRGDFSEADLRGASFVGARIWESGFAGADLSRANARGAEFYDAIFEGATFAEADFTKALLHGSNMAEARFRNANFTGANLKRADLNAADLRGAVWEGAEFEAARIDCATRLPKEFDIREKRLIPVEPKCGRSAQNRDFSEGNWDYADFSALDLSGANFRKAHTNRTDFTGADLSGADLSETNGQNNKFSGADLSGASFKGSTLSGVFYSREEKDERRQPTGKIFGPAALDKTDFTGASIPTNGFLGDGWSALPNDVDLSTAIFEGASMECSARRFRREIEDYNNDDSRRWRPDPGDSEKLANAYRQRREEDYRYALAWLEAEGALVRSLAAKWPTMTFGKECQAYFDAPEN